MMNLKEERANAKRPIMRPGNRPGYDSLHQSGCGTSKEKGEDLRNVKEKQSTGLGNSMALMR